jgi:hypothetical protein
LDALGSARWLSRAVSLGSAVHVRRQVHIVARRGHCAYRRQPGGSTWPDQGRVDGWPPRPRSFSLVIPAIPTNGLAQPEGIILAVRFIRPRGVFEPEARVSSPHVPNVGITGTIHNSPVIRLLGHRSTGHTTPTGPMIRLSPVDQMVCAATRPISALERGVPGVSPGPRKARPGG